MANDLDLGFTDNIILAAAHAITNAWTDVGPVIDTRKRNKLGLLLKLTIGTSTAVQWRVVLLATKTGTDLYSLPIQSVAASLVSDEPEVHQFKNDASQNLGFEIDVLPAEYCKLQVKDAADGTGTLGAIVTTGFYGG